MQVSRLNGRHSKTAHAQAYIFWTALARERMSGRSGIKFHGRPFRQNRHERIFVHLQAQVAGHGTRSHMDWLRAPMQVPNQAQWWSCVSTQRSQAAQWCARSR